jgi:hypothetical protein
MHEDNHERQDGDSEKIIDHRPVKNSFMTDDDRVVVAINLMASDLSFGYSNLPMQWSNI